jgi:hypothetical protein
MRLVEKHGLRGAARVLRALADGGSARSAQGARARKQAIARRAARGGGCRLEVVVALLSRLRSDLASIRNEPEFTAVFADIERDMAQQRARLAARPKDAPLKIEDTAT